MPYFKLGDLHAGSSAIYLPSGYSSSEKRPLVIPFLDSFQVMDNSQNPQYAVSRMVLLISRGALRTLRICVRRVLLARLARACISRETSTAYSHSGTLGQTELKADLMAKAWPKDDYSLRRALAQSAGAWVDYNLKITTSFKSKFQKTLWRTNDEG